MHTDGGIEEQMDGQVRVFEFEWGIYAQSASEAIQSENIHLRTYNCITYSVR